MKRSDFLKRLGIGVAAIAVAPKVLAETPAKEEKLTYHLNANDEATTMEGATTTTTTVMETTTYEPKSIHSHVKASDEFINEFSTVYDTMLKPDVYEMFVKHYKRVPIIDIFSL